MLAPCPNVQSMTAEEHEPIDPANIDRDERYRDHESLWSGEVNGSLAIEVEGLQPGRALDVGCGEGADAVWLAHQGWDVTAIDIAPTAVDRGRAAADERGLAIDWRAGDLLAEPPELAPMDLVSVHYPAFPIHRLNDITSVLTGWVSSGGILLLVGHAPPEDPSTAPFCQEDWVQPADIAPALGEGWSVEVHETRPRPGEHHEGSPHSHDVVVRARKI